MIAYVSVKFRLQEEDRQKLQNAIEVMQNVVDCVSKVYGQYDGYGCLEDAIAELTSVLDGTCDY